MNPILKLNLARRVQQAKKKLENNSNTKEDITSIQASSTLSNMKYEQILLLSAKRLENDRKNYLLRMVYNFGKFYSTCISSPIMDNDVNNHERFKWMVILG